jgi:enterochelin esterase family protein
MSRVIRTLIILAALGPAAAVRAQDMPLSQVLIDGEDWQLVAEGYGFTDACAADGEGNFYFSDVKSGASVYKVDPAGTVSIWRDGVPGISGLQFGPDRKLYACQNKLGRVIRIAPGTGEIETLVANVQPNDLVVTHQGAVYFTDTKPKEIHYVSPRGEHKVVHQGDLVRPNGITLSPDQGTLIVSDHGGKEVWAFRIESDGSLSAPEPYMTVVTPLGTDESKGDGSTTDAYGRYFVTTAVGLQMFDPTGRLCGVIATPAPKPVSVEFAGPGLAWIYLAADGKIFRRKTISRGLLFQDAPVKPLVFGAPPNPR